MEVDEAGERQRKRLRTQQGADFSASTAGDDIDEDFSASSAGDDIDDASDSEFEGSADSSSSSVASSHPQPQPEPEPRPQSRVHRVDPTPRLGILNRIQRTNTSLLTHLSRLETPAGVRAKEVALGQAKLITELRDTFLNAISKGALIQDGCAVFLKASDLFRTQGDFLLSLTGLPGVLGGLVLKQDDLISDLRRCYLVAAADPSNWTEAPEISSPEATLTTPVIATTPGIGAVASDTQVDDDDTADSSSTICSGIYV
ncbi:unnamed protein product [Urochloa humidicola]